MPKDETEAVDSDTFIGRTAIVALGEASVGEPAQCRLKDQFGQNHYVMVEPDIEGVAFSQGATVLLVRREGGTFFAIANPKT